MKLANLRAFLLMFALATLFTLAVATAVASTGGPVAPRQAGVSGDSLVPCRTLDSAAADFRDYITEMVTAADSAAVDERAAWELPGVTSVEVSFVSDTPTCDRAARAHAREIQGDTISPAPVHVLAVGATRYVAFNYHRTGEWLTYLVFDAGFVLLADMGS